MDLTFGFIKEKIEYMNDLPVLEQKKNEWEKYMFYNGSTKFQVEEAIKKEFTDPDTVDEMKHRIMPYNFMRKIVNKISAVYLEAPDRLASNQDEMDQELIEKYESSLMMNVRMKEANRMFKLFKKALAEIYIDEMGMPRIRVLPAHTYFAFSHSMVSPERPDLIVKILKHSHDPAKQMYAFYTDTNFLIVDGKAQIDRRKMDEINNPEGINPFGTLPFAYINESNISTEPIPDDDLISICKTLPVLLTDLAFASKYQSYSLIWTVDYDGDIPSGPKAVLHLNSQDGERAPSVNQLSPSVQINATLDMIESNLNYLLSSRNLKTTTITGQLSADNAASGVSKAIDNAQLNEEQKIDQALFTQFENQIWTKLKENIIPTWRKQKRLSQELNTEFSQDFSIVLRLREPKTTLTEMEQIEISRKKLEADPPLSTLRRELAALNPDATEKEIEALEMEIREQMRAPILEINGEQSQIQDQSA